MKVDIKKQLSISIFWGLIFSSLFSCKRHQSYYLVNWVYNGSYFLSLLHFCYFYLLFYFLTGDAHQSLCSQALFWKHLVDHLLRITMVIKDRNRVNKPVLPLSLSFFFLFFFVIINYLSLEMVLQSEDGRKRIVWDKRTGNNGITTTNNRWKKKKKK